MKDRLLDLLSEFAVYLSTSGILAGGLYFLDRLSS